MRTYLTTIFQAAGVLLALCPARAQFLPAQPPVNTGGSAPTFVAVGNFNSDSILDLAVSNTASNTVTLLMGSASKAVGFTAGTPIPVASPGAIAVADFDQDGFQDLAILNQANATVTVLLLDGKGGVKKMLGPYATGNFPASVAAATLNSDSYPDLAIANRDSGSVTVLLWNASTAGFSTPTNIPLTPISGSGQSPSSVVAGVFNAQGYMDLVVADQFNNTVTLLQNNGMGTAFSASAGSPYLVGSGPSSMVAADFNGDGFLDLAVANLNSNFVTLLLGNGTDGFRTALTSPFATGLQPVAMVTADFNGDALPDLAIANAGSNNVTVLLNNGVGGFTVGANSPFAAGPGPTSIAVGDFNEDGAPDLVVTNPNTSSVTVLLNASSPAPNMVSAASYSASAGVAPGSIVTILNTIVGVNTATAMEPAAGTCFNEIGVNLTDTSGAINPMTLFYAGPTQLNAIVPPAAAAGAATFNISIYSDPPSNPICKVAPNPPQKGSVTVNTVAPSLFTANSSGKGLPWAQFVSSTLTGGPGYVFSCTTTTPKTCNPVPLDVSSGTALLVLYGTGIRNRALLSNVTVTVGGQTLPALFAGPAPGYLTGTDQVNVALPSSLAGLGAVFITVSIGTSVSNPVTVCFTNPQNSPQICGSVTPYLH